MAASKPKRTVIDPFQKGVQKPGYVKLLYPSSVGAVTGAALALSPTLLGRTPAILGYLPRPLTRLPNPVCLALLGFSAGYVATKTADWIRWKVIKRLLQYQGWVHGSKAIKTQAWAMLLKLLKGPGPAETYDFQRSLPHLPLPQLDDTLDIWLNVTAQLVTKEEFEQTKDAVERFRNNEGPKLQQHLQKRYNNTVNWLSEYWLNIAYLAGRDPIGINSNYFLLCKSPEKNMRQLDRAAGSMFLKMEFHEMVEHNKLPPVELQNLVPLCMNGYRYIFSTSRIPGEHIDRIQRYPGETHVVVIRNGHYYALEMYTGVAGQKNKRRILSAEEIKVQLEKICKHADALPRPLPVSSLTSQNRTKWAKQREVLAVKNGDTLKCVESALFAVSLETDDIDPMDIHEHCQRSLSGRGGDRWYDKCFTAVYYPSGVYGCNVEHSGIDAMVITSMSEYLMTSEKYENNGLIPSGKPIDQNLPTPIQLPWDVEDMADDIKQANTEFLKAASDLDCHQLNTKYGKGFMKKCRLSPDGYIQMALQLAYYRLHKETPKTYEPSTSRLYALGRTENIHPMSVQSKAWVNVMCDPASTKQSRQDLLKRAIGLQTKARLHATIGKGCDRHLAGLYCASRELGMDVPAIYMDKAWQLPFKLSTSQTPTRTVELGADVDFKWVNGGFAPVCPNGYGLCYVMMGEDLVNMAITAFNSCEETGAKKLADAIDVALDDMKELFA